jgi:hypothetical protein
MLLSIDIEFRIWKWRLRLQLSRRSSSKPEVRVTRVIRTSAR